nr:hypothetical protein [Tanacetum cinerariifolium]
MVEFLSKSDSSAGFDHIMDFLNAHTIQYALVCLSAKRTAWNEFSCSMASDVICLGTGRKFNYSKYIFDSMVRKVDNPNKFLMYPRFLQVLMDNQVDELTSHNTRYTSPALTQKVFSNMKRVGKSFSRVEIPLFASMLVPPQPQAEEEEEQPTATTKSSMSLLNTLLETCATMIDREEGNAASKDVSVVEPYVFDDEEVTMTMAQTLIKMNVEKAKLLDEQIAQKLHDDEYDDKEENIDWNAIAEHVQERHLDNVKKYQNLKKKPISIAQARKNMIIYLKNMAGYKMEHFRGMTYDKVRPIFKREYKKVQNLFKPDKDVEEPKKKRVADETLLQEYVQNMLEIVSGLEFKVKALQVKCPIIDWEIHIEGSRTYWKIIRVSGITEAYQSFEDMLKGFDREDLVALWNLVKEKFSSAMPSVDKEKALWVELKRLFKPDANGHVYNKD